MVQITKIGEQAFDLISTGVRKAEQVITKQSVKSTSEKLVVPETELLQSYKGVVVRQLFSNLSEFVNSFKENLAKYKEIIPDEIYQKLLKKADNNDFSLQEVISEYYSKLNDCKTLEEVRKAYPEINAPDLRIEEEIKNSIRGIIPKELCEKISKMTSLEEKQRCIREYLDASISKQVDTWEIYPEFQKFRKSIEQEVINGDYKGRENISGTKFKLFNNPQMPLEYRLLHTEDAEKTFIDMLKEHYINGKNMTEICATTTDGKPIFLSRLNKYFEINGINSHFRQFLESSEHTAKQFKELAHVDKDIISSAIMTRAWRTSRLRVDLSNETKFGKNFSIVKSVWHKSMFPEATIFQTDKLVDSYLLSMFKAGRRQAETKNPLFKYTKDPKLSDVKIRILKTLYRDSKNLEENRRIIESQAFKDFKAQFDTEEIGKAIESFEQHYKNYFFKMFWTDARKMRFSQALQESHELAKQNIEISDKLLNDAMITGFEL